MGAQNMTIDSMTIGYDHDGFDTYREALRIQVLNDTRDLINDVGEVETAINNAWQGVSRDRFLEQFESARNQVSDDLEAEYNDLAARLTDLEVMYINQDKNMIEE